MTTAPPDQLIEALQDAHAMEVTVFESLASAIATTHDAELVAALSAHKQQTDHHARRLEERLHAHGHEASNAKDLGSTLKATAKGLTDQMRTARPAKNARDLYAGEHMEIAAYSMLERLARRVGDLQTATTACENRREEEAMAAWIADRWDRFVDLTLDPATWDG